LGTDGCCLQKGLGHGFTAKTHALGFLGHIFPWVTYSPL
jgi:hypothetical protein